MSFWGGKTQPQNGGRRENTFPCDFSSRKSTYLWLGIDELQGGTCKWITCELFLGFTRELILVERGKTSDVSGKINDRLFHCTLRFSGHGLSGILRMTWKNK